MTTSSDTRLGSRHGFSLSAPASWLVVGLLMLGSLRGLLVINFDLPAITVYRTVAAALLLLAAYGFVKSNAYTRPPLAFLKRLLALNLLLGAVYIAIDFTLGAPFQVGSLYALLAPYAVFVFLRVPTRYLTIAIAIITVLISYSVIDNFLVTLRGPEGLQAVYDYNLRLRPDVFRGFSRTGNFLRASGYTGSYHDSANILGMASAFLLVRFLLAKHILDLGLFSVAIVSLTLTQSAANIVVAIFTVFLVACYLLVRTHKASTYLYFLLGVVSIIALIVSFGDAMSIFTVRIGPDRWHVMTLQLHYQSLVSSIPFFLVGHAAAFGSQSINTEVAALKGVYQWGIIHAAILYSILLYPLLQFWRARSHCSEALPSAAAILFGVMSLVHYGSLFRVTSIFLFYAFSAICLNQISDCGRLTRESPMEHHQ